ncbi:MAG: hypothetical protein A2Y88_13455 [Chloroflexi bacterium RBG_13_48_10]|nr:MAG: hypothetical protein A2Y88_13455 [Chloroflexi bacterium RBG_13_48_10]
MKIKFSGSVHYANGAPLANVSVRVFDQDALGKKDDDLTVTPGISDNAGRFNLTYEPMRYLDFHSINPSTASNEPFNTADAESGLRLPDFGDIYLAYIQFTYTHNGRDRQHRAPLRIFQTKFLVPENPPVEFLPSLHGFHFPNKFAGYFLPFSAPAFITSSKVARNYGLCGGMCAAAYDFALTGRIIPQTNNIPHQGTRLHRYLFQRQIDSFGGMAQQLVKVAQWTSLPDDTLMGTQSRTADEFNTIRQKLDDKNPVILALIYEHASSMKELSYRIFNNHQVLAYAYQQNAAGGFVINIYDPNLPGRDDVIIQTEPVILGVVNANIDPTTVSGLKSTQLLGGSFYVQVRGFLGMPYVPILPPKLI